MRSKIIQFLWIVIINSQYNNVFTTTIGAASNRVEDIQVQCTENEIHLLVQLSQPFLGLIYSVGFPIECVTQGVGERVIALSLPTTGCGVRLTNSKGGLRWVVGIDVQFDRQLQLAADERKLISCLAPIESVASSRPIAPFRGNIDKPSNNEKHPLPPNPPQALRRAMPAETDFNAPSASGSAKFWMTLESSNFKNRAIALVGEPITLSITAKLPDVMSMRVADCRAHDGAGDSPQKLSDAWGCSLETTILPQFNYTRHDESHIAKSIFPAFKFPDRDSLHLQCALLICRGQCPVARCPDGSWPMESQYNSLPTGKIVGRLEVFNSIRVAAPGIEIETSEVDIDNFATAAQRADEIRNEVTPNNRSLCISPTKMALAFAALGAILVIAVAVALYSATRGRRYKAQQEMHPRIIPNILHSRPLPYVRVMH